MKALSNQNPIKQLKTALPLACMAIFQSAGAQGITAPSALPRITIENLTYEGGFRLPAAPFGVSEMNYSQGPLAYNPKNNSIFIVGHSQQQAIAEFKIPELVKSKVLKELKMAAAPIQPFVTVLNRAPEGNPEHLDKIGGLRVFESPTGTQLVVNAYEYYDGNGDNTETSLVLRDATQLASSKVEGFFAFSGGAGHTSGWMSPVPTVWQPLVGGKFLTGQSSGLPIINRFSVGPSAFTFEGAEFTGLQTLPVSVPTTKMLDFSLDNPLHTDLNNKTKTNNLWNHLSRVVYGMIVPGTSTYLTLGFSGGHVSGVCYKCTQNDGYLCGGYCAPDANDYYQMYWLWDMNDLLKVKAGTLKPYEVRPYAYGQWSTPFNLDHEIGGGAFDEKNGILYLTIQKGDNAQGEFTNPPVVIAYKFTTTVGIRNGRNTGSTKGYDLRVDEAARMGKVAMELSVDRTQAVQVSLLDLQGRELESLHRGTVAAGKTLSLESHTRKSSDAVYLLRVTGEDFSSTRKLLF